MVLMNCNVDNLLDAASLYGTSLRTWSCLPLPSPGMGQILFSVDCYQLTVEAPPKDGFPHADVG